MNVVRAIRDGRGRILSNQTLDKVSEAEQMDSIFLSKEEKDSGIIAKVNELLEPKGLEVVESKLQIVPSTGNFRTFIGEKNYQRPETALE